MSDVMQRDSSRKATMWAVRWPPMFAERQRPLPSRAKGTKATAANRAESAKRRKLIEFDEATWQALDLYARDSMHTIQELADEAFEDLLKKHHRPLTLKDA